MYLCDFACAFSGFAFDSERLVAENNIVAVQF